ncbi:MAG: membrane protein insertase YidC [Clostridia bacterium]
MDIINTISQKLSDIQLIGQFVGWLHSWIHDYGLTVIIFTCFLKLATLPLDFWQRYSMKKSSALQEELKPQMLKIDKQFANDQQRAMQEKQKINKKYGVSFASGCLPLIVTMAVFMFMFTGLSAYSSYSSNVLYNTLVKSYNTAYCETYLPSDITKDKEEIAKIEIQIKDTNKLLKSAQEAGDEEKVELLAKEIVTITALKKEKTALKNKREAQAGANGSAAVSKTFDEKREGFLWVKNIYLPDTWVKVFPSYYDATKTGGNGQGIDKTKVTPENYKIIEEAVMKSKAGKGYFGANWNGLLLLPLLSIGLSLLSSFIAQKMNVAKNATVDPQTAKTNKIMMFVTPLIFAFFVFQYTSAFGVYMVANSIMTILLGLIINPITDKIAMRKVSEKFDSLKPTYSRKK